MSNKVIRLFCLLVMLKNFAMPAGQDLDFSDGPWLVGEDMTTKALLRAKKVLADGGVMYLRTEMDHRTRYARVLQGPDGPERTGPTGSVFLCFLIPLEFHLGN